jgi:hypothetical protein
MPSEQDLFSDRIHIEQLEVFAQVGRSRKGARHSAATRLQRYTVTPQFPKDFRRPAPQTDGTFLKVNA